MFAFFGGVKYYPLCGFDCGHLVVTLRKLVFGEADQFEVLGTGSNHVLIYIICV